MAKTHPHIEIPSQTELSGLIEGKPPLIRQLYLDAHRLVLEAVPDLRYSVDREDYAIGYGARQFGYDGWGMAAVTPFKNWVAITFMRGSELEDPDSLLEGTSIVRYVRLRSVEQAAACREAVKRLLAAAARVHV